MKHAENTGLRFALFFFIGLFHMVVFGQIKLDSFWSKLQIQIGKEYQISTNAASSDEILLEPLHYLPADLNKGGIYAGNYIPAVPTNIQTGQCIECSYHSDITNYSAYKLSLQLNYPLVKSENLYGSVSVFRNRNAIRMYMPTLNTAYYTYNNFGISTLYFNSPGENDTLFISSGSYPTVNDSMLIVPLVKTANIRYPYNNFGGSLGVKFQITEKDAPHFQLFFGANVGFSSTFKQETTLLSDNYVELPVQDGVINGQRFGTIYRGSAGKRRIEQKATTVSFQAPPIIGISTSYSAELYYRPIKTIPVKLYGSIGVGFNRYRRDGSFVMKNSSFNIGAGLAFAFAR